MAPTDGEIRAAGADAKAQLRTALAQSGVELDPRGRTEHLEDNLVSAITQEQVARIRRDFSGKAGNELTARSGDRPKLHSAYSSAALAVNSFGPFIGREHQLALGLEAAFSTLAFEVQLPTGLGGTPPHLDLVLERDAGIVAIESKCTEHLAPKLASFAPTGKYDPLVARVAHPSWQREYSALREDPARYRMLDAAQLVKHYLGIKRTGRPATLVYVYWEPAHPNAVHRAHADEVRRFATAVNDPACRVVALSYPELWRSWQDGPAWQRRHVADLRRRYTVEASVRSRVDTDQ